MRAMYRSEGDSPLACISNRSILYVSGKVTSILKLSKIIKSTSVGSQEPVCCNLMPEAWSLLLYALISRGFHISQTMPWKLNRTTLLYCLILLSSFALLVFFGTAIVADIASSAIETHAQYLRRLASFTEPPGRNPKEERSNAILEGLRNTKNVVTPWLSKKIVGSETKEVITSPPRKSTFEKFQPLIVSILADYLPLKVFVPSIYLRIAGDKKAAMDVLFDRYEVGGQRLGFFASPQFQKWFTVIKKAYDDDLQEGFEVLLSSLTGRYNKNTVFELLAEASEDSMTRETGEVLDYALINKWVGKSYLNLQLILTNPDFQSWLFCKPPTAWESAIGLLLLKIEKSDARDSLDDMLAVARWNKGDASFIAYAVEIFSWKRDGLSAEMMFKKLKFDTLELEDLLHREDLHAWYYLLEHSGDAPNKMLMLYYRQRLSDKGAAMLLFRIAKGENTDNTELAENVLDELLSWWITESKWSAVEAAKCLGLNELGKKLLGSVELDVWNLFLLKLHGEKRYDVMLQELRNIFGEDLAKMIAQGKQDGVVVAKKLARAAIESDKRVKTSAGRP